MSDVCHQVIASDPDGNDWDSCDRPAVGVRASLQDGDPYPVCDRHLCGGCGDAWHNRCTPIPPPPERAILTGLIAELRELNQNRDGGMWAEDVHDAADRAARLKGINDE